MRILFTGAAPWVNSGYGKPLRYLIPLLHEAGHQCAIAAYYGFMGGVADTGVGGAPARIYPPFKDLYFNDCIQMHAQDWQADVVISLQDVWLLDGWAHRGFNWLPWVPIDCDRVTPPAQQALAGCATPISMSKHGRDLLTRSGWPNARYVPFGVDLDTYRPGDKSAARAACGLPSGKFVAGMIAGNASFPARKSFPEVLMAWRRWLDKGNDGVLYIHTCLQDKRGERRGIFFPVLLESLGLRWTVASDAAGVADAEVVFPDAYRYWCGDYDDAELARLMNCFDVLLSPSQAEGFGIPILEAQACGVPVVTQNCTAMPEITFSGLCLDPVQPAWELQGGWRGLLGVDDLVGALDWASDVLVSKTGHQHYAERARVGALDFSWQKTVDNYWLPLLREVENATN